MDIVCIVFHLSVGHRNLKVRFCDKELEQNVDTTVDENDCTRVVEIIVY